MKRAALVALAIVVFLMPLAAEAQQARKVPRVGVLASGDTQAVEAFKQGLRDLGYVEGQHIVTVWRFYEGRADRALALAAQLLRAELDVLVATGPPAFEAAKELTATIPIVALGGTDPVGTGLVVSLARPSGNITGLTIGHPEENRKRLQLLKEVVPNLSRVAIIRDYPITEATLRQVDDDALAVGLRARLLQVRSPDDWIRPFKPRYENGLRRSMCQESHSFGFTPTESGIWPSNTGFPELVHRCPRRQGF